MKKLFLLSIIFSFSVFFSKITSGQTVALLRDWAAFAGHTDSVFRTPVVNDGDYTYVASCNIEPVTGVDILVTKYDKDGNKLWGQDWTGAGNGRDQPSGMVMDSLYLYVSGMTFTSSTNNFDFVTIKVSKSDGHILWNTTYNGIASSSDIASAIVAAGNNVYVTGASSGTGTSFDYAIIKYDKSTGTEQWVKSYDYNGLMDIPFAIAKDSQIVITGGSQSTTYDWDYCTLRFNADGDPLDTTRVSGSASGFDRALAVQTDDSSNVYITGTTYENGTDFDAKTVKINADGSLAWIYDLDLAGHDDQANDLLIDNSHYVYICGQGQENAQDGFVVRLNAGGERVWTVNADNHGKMEEFHKMCFDSWGNIIATGRGQNPDKEGNDFEFLSVGYSREGTELWRDYFDGGDNGDDNATNITADANGNIFVTGQAWVNSELQTVTIKYRTDYFTELPPTDTPSSAYLFYPNSGQIVDLTGSNITDSVHYYTLHHYPELYFGYGVMNMVWAQIDNDTTTTDSLQRVDVSFYNSSNATQAFALNESDSAGYLNYFMNEDSVGITEVYGNEKLLYEGVYNEIDAVYSSNKEGLKLTFICSPNCGYNPEEIGLQFDGQDSILISNNWGLIVQTALGSYEFERPRIYQLDENDSMIQLNFQLHWTMYQPNVARLAGWGSFDSDKKLVIEISKVLNVNLAGCNQNLCWCTYLGRNYNSASYDLLVGDDGFIYQVGETVDPQFPPFNAFQGNLAGSVDAFIIKYNSVGDIATQENREFMTFYGGPSKDGARGVAINSVGEIYVTGYTESPTFPKKQSSFTGVGTYSPFYQTRVHQSGLYRRDAYIIKFRDDGQRVRWATFFGGEGDDKAYDVAVTSADQVYIVGETDDNTGFPIQASSNSSSYNQSHFAGASPPTGDGFIARFNEYDELKWCSYLGGTEADRLSSMCLLSDGKVGVTGTTASTTYTTPQSAPGVANSNGDFPLCGSNTNYGYSNTVDLIIAVFNSFDQMEYCTNFGGDGTDGTWDDGRLLAAETYPKIASKNVLSDVFCVTGTTNSGNPDFSNNTIPIVNNSSSGIYYDQSQFCWGNSVNIWDVFFAVFSSNTLVQSSYFGGDGDETNGDVAFGPNDDLYISGNTTTNNGVSPVVLCANSCGDFPLCNLMSSSDYFDGIFNGQRTDGFIARFNSDYELTWSTYFGGYRGTGTAEESVNSLAVATNKYLYVAGYSNSFTSFFPLVEDPNLHWEGTANHTGSDAFIGRFKLPYATGISNIDREVPEIRLFPNPAHDHLSLIFEPGKISKSIRMYNFMGQELYINHRVVRNNSQISIDLTGIPAGIYFLQFDSNPFGTKFIIE